MRISLCLMFAGLLPCIGAEPAGLAAAQTDGAKQGAAETNLSQTLSQQADALRTSGKYEEALPVAQQAVESFRNLGTTNTADYAISLNNLALLYKLMGRNDEALQIYRQSLENLQKTVGENHLDYAGSLYNLAGLYKAMGRPDDTLPLYQRALAVCRRALGESDPSYGRVLTNLAGLYKSMKRYDDALPLYEQELANRKQTQGENDIAYAIMLHNLAQLYQEAGRYSQALSHFQQTREIVKRMLGENHPDYATSLNNLAGLFMELRRHDDALSLYKQALEIYRKTLGENHPAYAASLNSLAALYGNTARYVDALPLFQQALEISRKTFGATHPNYISSLDKLGGIYHAMGRNYDALPLWQQVRDFRKNALGELHPDYATSLNNLANLYASLNQNDEALLLCQQATNIRRQALGEHHPDYARSLNNLATLYVSTARYVDALGLLQQAVAIFRQELGETNSEFATSLNNLALLYKDLGRHEDSLPLLQQALVIKKQILGENHPDFATSLNNLALLYHVMGRYDEALPLLHQARKILSQARGIPSRNYAGSQNNLATLFQEMGRYDEALSLLKEAVVICKQALGEHHPDYARSLNNLAALYEEMGRNDDALPLIQQAREIYRVALGESHPDFATSLNNLALLYRVMRRDDDALPIFQEACAVYRSAVGQTHPSYARSLNPLSKFYLDQGKLTEAQSLALEALPIASRADVPKILCSVQSNLRAIFAKQARRDLAIFFGKQAVNTIQSMRGRQTRLDKELRESFLKKNENDYRVLAGLLIEEGRFGEAQQVLAMLKEEEFFQFIRGNPIVDAPNRPLDLNAWEITAQQRFEAATIEAMSLLQKKEVMERRLGELNAAERQELAQLQQRLKIQQDAFGAILDEIYATKSTAEKRDLNLRDVEALQATLEELGDGVVLLHYVVTEDRLHIILTTPGGQWAFSTNINRTLLNKWVFALLEELRNERPGVLAAAQALYPLVLGPVADHLRAAGAKTLMVSLDGTLRYIPLGVLHDGVKYSAEDYRVVVFTEKGRDKLKNQPKTNWRVAGMGLTLKYEGFKSLPNVQDELEGIVKTSQGRGGVLPGDIWLDKDFTKERLQKALIQQTPVLHVATHFVFKPTRAGNSFLLLGDGTQLSLRTIESEKWKFGGVDLLALSACETAVSEEKPGSGEELESLATLTQQRGAKGILATLWPVDDASTSLLMQEFYRLREEKKLSKAQALREAQLALLQGRIKPPAAPPPKRGGDVSEADIQIPARKAPADYRHPYYWAPFILIGNWL